MKRTASITRKTKETAIDLRLALDGGGTCSARTDVGFLDHMLELLGRFAGFTLSLKGKGDLRVDEHHLVEDSGICLGQALDRALGDKRGIARFGFASMPMDEALVEVSLDISGRPLLVFNVPKLPGREGAFELADAREFLQGFVNHAKVTLHVNFVYGENLHHVNEAVFKGLGLALREAVRVEGRRIPSTKGSL
jgi:imidazoleglycerol-phosphate dehydratase